MDPFLANPFPSIVQISSHEAQLLEKQHATGPLKLPAIFQWLMVEKNDDHRKHLPFTFLGQGFHICNRKTTSN